MIRLSRLKDVGLLSCGRCGRPANSVLTHLNDPSSSSAIYLFCGRHLREYLDRRPDCLQYLLDRMGTESLFELYEFESDS
jgi:hypothetical protein